MPVTGPELALLVAGAVLAGLVRGFSGFGTAMVYLPVAGQVLSPFAALTTLVVMDLVGPLPNVPRALRDGHPRDVARLGIMLVAGVPVGLWILTQVDPQVFRYAVSAIALGLVICLLAGIRYRGTLRRWMLYVIGAVSGVLAGVAGLPGPPVILAYMASPHPAAVVRANTLLFLVLSDIVMLGVLSAFGKLEMTALWLGAVLIVPYLLANVAGAAMFRPDRERLYRWIAYGIITASALMGLPLLD